MNILIATILTALTVTGLLIVGLGGETSRSEEKAIVPNTVEIRGTPLYNELSEDSIGKDSIVYIQKPKSTLIEAGTLTQEVNKIRQEHGLSSLVEVVELNSIACNRATVIQDDFSHDGWMMELDRYWQGEVLARWKPEDWQLESMRTWWATNTLRGWLRSPSHKKVVLGETWDEMGWCEQDGYIVARFRKLK